MRIKRLDLLISPDDFLQFLLPYLQSDDVTDLSLHSQAGDLRIRFNYRFGVKVPVDLTLQVAQVRPEQLTLAVAARLGISIPGLIVQKVLEHFTAQLQIEAIRVDGPQVIVDIDLLGPYVNAWFRLRHLAFDDEGIRCQVDDLIFVPLDSQQEVGTALIPADAITARATEAPGEHRETYDQLRQKIASWAERKVPEKYRSLIPWLFLLPDLFALLCRLSLDSRVPIVAKGTLVAAIAYVLWPVDFIADFVPFAGLADDLSIVLLALASYLERAPEAVLREHWSGDSDAVALIRQGVTFVPSILGTGLWRALQGFLNRRWGDPEGEGRS